jgi:aminoglycoside 2'-N-acetyltransferase I
MTTFTLCTVSSRDMTPVQLGDVIALCSGVFHLDYAYYMSLCPDRVHVLGYADGKLASHALWLSRRLWVPMQASGPAGGAAQAFAPERRTPLQATKEPNSLSEVTATPRLALRAAYVEGVATHPDYRGRGYGSALMRHLQREIVERGFDLGALSPARAEWYERLGWVLWQGPLFIDRDGVVQATPDDSVVVYRAPHTGELDIRQPLTAEWRPFELW